jgi:signal transduction protein with GAF and PtsI domain
MSDNEQFDRDPPLTSAEAPNVEPPRLELLPYALADQAKRAGLAKAIAWGSALAAALALIAGVAAFGLYDHARQANLIAAKTEETDGLSQTIKGLEKRIDAIETARAHDETADMRKVAVEMKTEGAAGRELTAQLTQANARIDKLDHDHSARLDKLTDRLDHESAGKFADLSARLDKLEKHPVVAAVTPAKPAAPLAQPVSDETTGSIERPRLRGFWLVEAQDGYAVIDGRDGPQQVVPGDILSGVGRVQRIERRGADWVVVTSAGVIAGDQSPF